MSKYPRTYHLPYSPGSTNDDRISSSVQSLLGIDIVITEKLDGSNASITKNGVYARSHAVFSRNPWDREVRQLHDIKVKGQLEDDVFIFGENMEGVHSIEYSGLKSYFYMFGVRDNNIWIPWEGIEEYSYLLDIPTVPVLFKGIVNTEKELKDLVNDLVSKPSQLGGQIEGIVVRNASLFHNDDFADNVMKWVRKDHVQTTTHWTRDWKKSKINPV
jgi:hypothetical protein